MCVSILSTTFVSFPILRTQRGNINVHRPSRKVSQIAMAWAFSTDFRKILKLHFMKNLPLGTKMFHADVRTDKTDEIKTIVSLRSFANVFKNGRRSTLCYPGFMKLCRNHYFPRRAVLRYQVTKEQCKLILIYFRPKSVMGQPTALVG
jgi:hypothetical protein